MKNNITVHPISAWEKAKKGREEIDFEEINQVKGVISVRGFIIVRGKRYRAEWMHDGKCYYNGIRARQHDIKF